MKNIALALALVLAGSSLAVGLISTDANAGGRKLCKQALMAFYRFCRWGGDSGLSPTELCF